MHPSKRLPVGFALFVGLAFLYTITTISARDPTSVFFRPRKGYAPRYSEVRRQQADAFISSYNPANVVKTGEESKRKLCIGIPSFKREKAQYLPDAVGSLLEGLTPEERKEIYLMVFLPHSNPAIHPSYSEAWLTGLTDKVLTYEYGADRMQHIRELETKEQFDEKALFDYTYLLEKCAEQFTPYVVMIEDDVVAMDGWYHRTIAAIHEAERQAALRRAKASFFYLRLFYTESFFGWHSQNWKRYLFNSICFAALPTIVILLMRFSRPTTKLSLTLTTRRTFITLYALVAAVILIFFSLGRITVVPISFGVHEMPRFGCCSQAFVFPNTKAVDLVAYFRERHMGYVDVLIEDFANERGELRYATTPSLVQHAGRRRSKEDDSGSVPKPGTSFAENIWSFGFEKFDWKVLKREHGEMARMRSERDPKVDSSIADR